MKVGDTIKTQRGEKTILACEVQNGVTYIHTGWYPEITKRKLNRAYEDFIYKLCIFEEILLK